MTTLIEDIDALIARGVNPTEAARIANDERQRQLTGAAAGFTSSNTFFQVVASVTDSKKSKGYRYSLYKTAMECHAYHPTIDIKRTIFYEEGSSNLRIRLIFSTKDHAEEFQNKLLSFSAMYSHFGRKLNLERSIVRVDLIAEPARVLIDEYESLDNAESPDMSLNDMFSDASVVSLSHDPSHTLKALEDVDKVAVLGTKWYKCHLISAKNKQFEKNPDNLIYASWQFHQHLDGLNTLIGVGLAIRFEKVVAVEEVSVGDRYETRHRISVIVEFRNPTIASVFEPMFKFGTEKISDVEFRSYLYAVDPNVMIHCLQTKYVESKSGW